MDAEREFEIKCEDRANALGQKNGAYTDLKEEYFYICPNQFDGDDEASEAALRDTDVDAKILTIEYARMIADRLAASVGHRVIVTRCTHTSSFGRDYERAYIARAPIGKVA